jgi:ribonucleoside-diphosphate reductase beta chain
MAAHTSFKTATTGLRRDLPPMVLFEKAKRFGVWNPSDLDFSQDRRDWEGLAPAQQDLLLRLTAMFVAGEEAVTRDLLPLIQAVAAEGRIEEELYLTTFLWEEAKHVDLFSRFLEEVCGAPQDLERFHGTQYRGIIGEALPEALGALREHATPAALVRASCVYNMVVEGMLAETGYHAYFRIMDEHNILPGQRQGVLKLKQDESRHIAYGVYLISRLISEDPALWEVAEATMGALLLPGLGVVEEVFGEYDPVPFRVTKDEFLAYATGQFQKRLDRIRRARGMSLEEVAGETHAIIEANDG